MQGINAMLCSGVVLRECQTGCNGTDTCVRPRLSAYDPLP